MKPLVGRMLDIATGEAGLPVATRERYREEFRNRGFAVPDVLYDDPPPRAKRVSSRIGDSIKNKILGSVGVGVPCNDCTSDINRLNLMQPSDVLDKLDWWTDRIFDRGKDKAHKWYQKLVVKYAPGIAKDTIRQWIIEACEDAQRPS